MTDGAGSGRVFGAEVGTAARLGAFVGILAVVALVALVVGRLAGPLGENREAGHAGPMPQGATTHRGGDHGEGHEHGNGAQAVTPAGVTGLAVSEGGYTLVPERTTLDMGADQRFRFRIVGPDGASVTRYAVRHDKLLHLVLARRDLSGYQHLHPTFADGVWEVPMRLAEPGVWRAFADFVAIDAAGKEVPLTLGVDLTVPGSYDPRELPAASRQDVGLTVSYEGELSTGKEGSLRFRVSRGDQPVTTVDRYLGAYGHLVVLRAGDLGYVHAHAENQLEEGAMTFSVTPPSPGRYRMFLDYSVDGVVRTAEFTIEVK